MSYHISFDLIMRVKLIDPLIKINLYIIKYLFHLCTIELVFWIITTIRETLGCDCNLSKIHEMI
jgi:hypothetical protein